MRYDMSEVLIERPRTGQYAGKTPKGSRRFLNPNFYEDISTKESIDRLWLISGQTKNFSDLIGPLHRFLLSRVGRSWNDIYSEIRERVSPNSQMQIHLLKHVMGFVETHVCMVNGKPYSSDGVHPLEHGRRVEFYVHPVTGLMLKQPKYISPEKKETWIWADQDKLTQYKQLKGVWYLIQLDSTIFHDSRGRIIGQYKTYFDVALKRDIHHWDEYTIREIYGGFYYAKSKTQLNSRKIRDAGLRKRMHPDVNPQRDC